MLAVYQLNSIDGFQSEIPLRNELKGHGHWVNTLALNTDYVIRSGPYSHEPAKFKDLSEKKEAARKRYSEAIEKPGSKYGHALARTRYTNWIMDNIMVTPQSCHTRMYMH